MPAPCFEAAATINKDQRLLPFALGLCPRLQTFQLGHETRFLSMSADPPIEQKPPHIEFASHPFNLRARHADLTAHLHHLDTSCLDPSPDRDRMQTQLVSCRSNT